MTTKPRGFIIYEGPSLIDGAPIFVVALTQSGNVKTGNMIQTYIMLQDVEPLAANKSGADFSICGNCRHRGTPHSDPDRKTALDRTCYVTLFHGPLNVYKQYKAGKYPTSDNIAQIGNGRKVRLGTYGDPAAVPSSIWDALLSDCVDHTAYSHQSDIVTADYRPDLFMQSADTLEQAMTAWDRDERTFRVVSNVNDVQPGEILCPASAEAGHRVQCHDCGLCAGSSIKAKSIAIVAHGIGAKHF